MLPFEVPIYRANYTGRALKTAYTTFLVELRGQNTDGQLLHATGIKARIDKNKPVNERVIDLTSTFLCRMKSITPQACQSLFSEW
jgi:hypothetical protein